MQSRPPALAGRFSLGREAAVDDRQRGRKLDSGQIDFAHLPALDAFPDVVCGAAFGRDDSLGHFDARK